MGRYPGVGNANLLQYLCWEIPWKEETEVTVHGVTKELDTTEQLNYNN